MVSALGELPAMGKNCGQAVPGQCVMPAVPARYMVQVGGAPHLLWGAGQTKRTSGKAGDYTEFEGLGGVIKPNVEQHL